MNNLTQRFLKYRATPKAAPTELLGPPCPHWFHPLGPYEHTGFLSAEETSAQRFDRLSQAYLAGYALTNDDYRWFKNWGRNGHGLKFCPKAEAILSEKIMRRTMAQSRPCSGGFQ